MATATSRSAPRPKAFQRLIARAARLLARGIYRSVEVDNPEPGWSWYPAIVVANHPTGFSDPALLLGLLERSPRFLAKATLWNTPGIGWFLDRLGAIPVYRAEDGSTNRNTEMFSAAYEALRQGYLIALFPEGGVRETPSIGEIKTGAARLALGAVAAGVTDLRIVPVGLHFEDKAALRGRAYVRVGDVLDADSELERVLGPGAHDAEDREAVDRLTDEIGSRLRAVAPEYTDDDQMRALSFAAEVTLRQPGSPPVSYADRQALSARLARLEPPAPHAIAAAAGDYRSDLHRQDVTDRDVMLCQGGARLRRRLAGLLALIVVLAPFALTGIVLNLVPVAALLLAMRFTSDAMTAATVRMVAAVAAFLAMWLLWASLAWSAWNWRMALVTFMAAPIYGAVALFTIERMVRWWQDLTGLRSGRSLEAQLDDLLATRRALVAHVESVTS